MADIKTRDLIKGTVKTIDKAAIAGERMKSAYISTKEKAEQSYRAAEDSVEEYAANRYEKAADRVIHDGAYQFDKLGRKGVRDTKENIRRYKEKRAIKALGKQKKDAPNAPQQNAADTTVRTTDTPSENALSDLAGRTSGRSAGNAADTAANRSANSIKNQTIKVLEKPERGIKQTAHSTGKKTIKSTSKSAVKAPQKTVKTAEQTAKTTIKTSQKVAKTAQKTSQATAKAAKAAAKSVRESAKAAARAAKSAAKATAAIIKAIIAAVKALVVTIAAGGWIAVVVIIIICLVALIATSVFGIFFSGEDSGTGQTMRTAIVDINSDYDNKLTEVKNATAYDTLEMSGSRAIWKEVVAVYAVKTNTDPENPQEVATMDDTKKQLLQDIFWEMNEILSHTETSETTVITETDDGSGNIIESESTETTTTLYIVVTHKTVLEMADKYGFTEEQCAYLTEILKDENNPLWAAVLYGINYADEQIVAVALSQLGTDGGEPYWSWYGFTSRVEWCACFVSWCANECGYIETGVIPQYAGCTNGVTWFQDRDIWTDGSAEPVAGMIVFFDWDDENGQDGQSDHTGIVEKVEDGIVYTVEGNSGDSVREKQYPVGYYEILGYGIPAY